MMKKLKKISAKKQSKKRSKKSATRKLHKSIQTTLIENLGWSKNKAKLAGSLIIGLLSTTYVWQKKLVQAMVDSANQAESDIRATQRFFACTEVDYQGFSRM